MKKTDNLFWGMFLFFLFIIMPSKDTYAGNYWQDPVTACEKGYSTPKNHYLPIGIGQVTIDKCFNNGFEANWWDVIGTCEIVYKDCSNTILYDDYCQTKHVYYNRRKYYCHFKGSGAILGKGTGPERSPGDKVFFQGEEPYNYYTTDPSCSEIKEMISNNSTLDHKY